MKFKKILKNFKISRIFLNFKYLFIFNEIINNPNFPFNKIKKNLIDLSQKKK